jgi:hypothetical protein
MDAFTLDSRLKVAQAYFVALELSFFTPWKQQHASYLAGHLALPEAMALLHPDHYAAWDYTDRIRGGRVFKPEASQYGLQCGASHIWGYQCSRNDLAADHVFPYSLGGPTTSTNKLLLCTRHNTAKSSDIHFYPWEQGEPPWLESTLGNIAIVVSRTP